MPNKKLNLLQHPEVKAVGGAKQDKLHLNKQAIIPHLVEMQLILHEQHQVSQEAVKIDN